MFNLFKKKTQVEIDNEIMLKGFKNIVKDINNNKGLHLEVCIDFVKFIPENDLFKSLRLIWADDCPHPKTHIMLSSLMLLGSIHKGTIKDKDDHYFNIAKLAFQTSNVILTSEELKPLLEDAELVIETRNQLMLKAQKSWDDWMAADPKFLIQISEL